MRQRLGLAAALLAKPRLLVLDEPANGLDPAGKKHVHGVLTRLAGEGTAVVLSSHRMDDLEALCSEVTILATGRVVFSGPLGELAAGNRELAYRLITSDPAHTRRLAAAAPGIRLADDTAGRQGGDVLVVHALVPALDALVADLVHAGIALRELAPVVSPLEAAFLALTEPRAATDTYSRQTDVRQQLTDAQRQQSDVRRQFTNTRQQQTAPRQQSTDPRRQRADARPQEAGK
jgi:ABC-2 type transport system ATP-binding protein